MHPRPPAKAARQSRVDAGRPAQGALVPGLVELERVAGAEFRRELAGRDESNERHGRTHPQRPGRGPEQVAADGTHGVVDAELAEPGIEVLAERCAVGGPESRWHAEGRSDDGVLPVDLVRVVRREWGNEPFVEADRGVVERRSHPELERGIRCVVIRGPYRCVREMHHSANGRDLLGGSVHEGIDVGEGVAQAPQGIGREVAVVGDGVPDRRVGELQQDGATPARQKHGFVGERGQGHAPILRQGCDGRPPRLGRVTATVVRFSAPPTGELAAVFAKLRDELHLVAAFPPEVEAEARAVAAHPPLPADDQTAVRFITIDPEGSTDLDQALHLERAANGYRVRYAIADVPAFVTPGGTIDAEARRRGQTMYAPDGRIPLHPTILSEDVASLLPNQVRGAFVWDFALDAAANVTAVTVKRARVTSRRKASYVEVQAELDAGTADEVVQLLREVGLKRIELEKARGGASLNRPDEEVEQDAGGYHIVRRANLPVEDWNAQLSLMTGMAAAELMLAGKIGILRTMPAPDDETIAKFHRQAVALGTPWPEGMKYGEYLRSLDPADPKQLAIIHAAGSLFRGAGYTAFDGEAPVGLVQAAVGTSYTHTTAPLRRLVDRFCLVTCEALSAGTPVPGWVRDALPTLPAIMASSGGTASRLDRACIDAVETAVLAGKVGQVFEATVISVHKGGGILQLTDPAVTADCQGDLEAGAVVRATLVTADVATSTLQFRVA